MSFSEFLNFLLVGGGGIVAVSWIWEKFNLFSNMSPEDKKMVLFGFSAAISLIAYAANQFIPAETIALIDPYFKIVAGLFYMIFIGNTFHNVNKAK